MDSPRLWELGALSESNALEPLAAAERIGYGLCSADDPDSPLWPVRRWLCLAEEQPGCCGGPSAELLAELRGLAFQLLAGPLS